MKQEKISTNNYTSLNDYHSIASSLAGNSSTTSTQEDTTQNIALANLTPVSGWNSLSGRLIKLGYSGGVGSLLAGLIVALVIGASLTGYGLVVVGVALLVITLIYHCECTAIQRLQDAMAFDMPLHKKTLAQIEATNAQYTHSPL